MGNRLLIGRAHWHWILGPELGLQDKLGQLLDEQRHPIGPLDDIVDDLLRQGLVANDSSPGRRHLANPAD